MNTPEFGKGVCNLFLSIQHHLPSHQFYHIILILIIKNILNPTFNNVFLLAVPKRGTKYNIMWNSIWLSPVTQQTFICSTCLKYSIWKHNYQLLRDAPDRYSDLAWNTKSPSEHLNAEGRQKVVTVQKNLEWILYKLKHSKLNSEIFQQYLTCLTTTWKVAPCLICVDSRLKWSPQEVIRNFVSFTYTDITFHMISIALYCIFCCKPALGYITIELFCFLFYINAINILF